jgi:hypothetical protein
MFLHLPLCRSNNTHVSLTLWQFLLPQFPQQFHTLFLCKLICKQQNALYTTKTPLVFRFRNTDYFLSWFGKLYVHVSAWMKWFFVNDNYHFFHDLSPPNIHTHFYCVEMLEPLLRLISCLDILFSFEHMSYVGYIGYIPLVLHQRWPLCASSGMRGCQLYVRGIVCINFLRISLTFISLWQYICTNTSFCIVYCCLHLHCVHTF